MYLKKTFSPTHSTVTPKKENACRLLKEGVFERRGGESPNTCLVMKDVSFIKGGRQKRDAGCGENPPKKVSG